MDGSCWNQKTFDRTFQELSNGVYLNGCNVKSHPQNNLKRLPFTPRSSVNWGYSFCFSVGIHAAAIRRTRTARRAVATAGGDVSQEECRAQKRKVKQNKKFILNKSIALKKCFIKRRLLIRFDFSVCRLIPHLTCYQTCFECNSILLSGDKLCVVVFQHTKSKTLETLVVKHFCRGLQTSLYWSTCTCRFGYFQQIRPSGHKSTETKLFQWKFSV